MQIVNTKTGVAFNGRTTKSHDGYVAIVSKYIPNPETEKSVYRGTFNTRSRAYRAMQQACKDLAANHAYVN